MMGNDEKLNEILKAWIEENEKLIYQNMKNNLGIKYLNLAYIEINETQNIKNEYNKISNFLNKYMHYYAKNNNTSTEDLNLEFINYGKTELVYVLTDKNGNRITLLVKQPAVKFGKVKQEAKNLSMLKIVDNNVIAPINYFCDEEQELYATPYINQARCIASDDTWGMYIPEPYYRFESFTKEQETIVNTCMIAKLISLYDFEKQEGICSCKVGGGDFMLPKGWETQTPTIENTLNNLYLIAAREKINCSFEDYLEIIRNEFSRVTIKENQDGLIINHRGRVAMKCEDIENGIKLGKNIIKDKSILETKNKILNKTKKEDFKY